MDRRAFLVGAASVLWPSRETDIAHFVPSGMFRGGPQRRGFCDTADLSPNATVEPFFRGMGRRAKIVGAPLLVEDLVCVGYCTVRNLVLRRKKPHKFFAVDVKTGRARWEFEAEKGIVSSPAYYDDTILVGGLDGRLYAYDLDGHRKWAFRAEGGIFGSVAVYHDYAVFGAGDMSMGRLYCLDIRGTRLVWPPVEMPAGPFASPCIAGGNVFLGTYWDMNRDAFYYVVDVHTGEIRKTFKLHEVCFCSTAASDGETVYIADCGEWRQPSAFHAWDARTAEEKWRLGLDADNVASSISLVGGLAVFGCDKGYLHAVHVEEQELAWRSLYRARAYHGSPCATPGRIYIGSQRRCLHVFDHEGKHLKAHKVGGIIESTPVIRDGVLFVGCNDGVLYRIAG